MISLPVIWGGGWKILEYAFAVMSTLQSRKIELPVNYQIPRNHILNPLHGTRFSRSKGYRSKWFYLTPVFKLAPAAGVVAGLLPVEWAVCVA